eukprot:5566869-Alexandrium_andersonii.AAC.1
MLPEWPSRPEWPPDGPSVNCRLQHRGRSPVNFHRGAPWCAFQKVHRTPNLLFGACRSERDHRAATNLLLRCRLGCSTPLGRPPAP